jgi:hypothetical protein
MLPARGAARVEGTCTKGSISLATRLAGSGLYAKPREKSLERFKEKVRPLTRRQQPIRLSDMIRRLNRTLRGWGTYLPEGAREEPVLTHEATTEESRMWEITRPVR